MARKKLASNRGRRGSALILAVVLTSLLAVVGVLFLMTSRIERIATSSIAENKELHFAAEAVVEKIARRLEMDVPGVLNAEYYDYPGSNDKWLASLEPYRTTLDPNFRWAQISDVTGYITSRWGTSARQDVAVEPINLSTTEIVREYSEITLDSSGELEELSADADGDGIADSKWIELEGVTTTKGKSIYAAIRVVDNGGMLNVNTAYEFDAAAADGSSQTQVNLAKLARVGDVLSDIADARNPNNDPLYSDLLPNYQDDLIWKIEDPCERYVPFDISDELEMRYRYCISSQGLTRLESVWNDTVGHDVPNTYKKEEPYAGGSFGKLSEWVTAVTDPYDPNHYRRHLLTTYNMDRIIDPNGDKMFCVNSQPSLAWVKKLYGQLVKSIDPNEDAAVERRMRKKFAQLAVNMADLRDADTNMTEFNPANDNNDPTIYYGIEPFPCITEIAVAIKVKTLDPLEMQNYYAVELFNPFDVNIVLDDFRLYISSPGKPPVPVWLSGEVAPNDYYVISNDKTHFAGDWEDSLLELSGGYDTVWDILKDEVVVDSNVVVTYNVSVKRLNSVNEGIFFDRQILREEWVQWDPNESDRHYQRDFNVESGSWWHAIYPRMTDVNTGSLGSYNSLVDLPLAIDINVPFSNGQGLVTIGDLSRILTVGPKEILLDPDESDPDEIYDATALLIALANDPDGLYGAYSSSVRSMGEEIRFACQDKDLEQLIRLDLANPHYQNIFQYVTVFDPSGDGIDNNGDGIVDPLGFGGREWKVPGRININTAPWYVIAQLPWMTEDIARAIVAYRDKLDSPVDYYGSGLNNGRYDAIETEIEPRFNENDIREEAGFASIGELNFVVADSNDPNSTGDSIRKYGADSNDLDEFPDLTLGRVSGDGAGSDYEERDIIFSRISNLVTVRSDVFTAYILVRLGTDGPQKRMIAILDRSDVYKDSMGKVKVRALQPVPDPR